MLSLMRTAAIVWPVVTGMRSRDVQYPPVRAVYLVNALRPVMALPTTSVLISFVPS